MAHIDRSCTRLSLYQPRGEESTEYDGKIGDGEEEEGFLGISDDAVLLDPAGNAPLKVGGDMWYYNIDRCCGSVLVNSDILYIHVFPYLIISTLCTFFYFTGICNCSEGFPLTVSE